MSRSLFIVFVSCLFVFAFAWKADARPGERGIFEAPMVEVDGDCTDSNDECSGSEGKVERNGDWKVEIKGVTDTETFEICIEDDNEGETSLVSGITADEDGELKATELSLGAVHVPNGIYVNPRLVVREADTCDGDVFFTTGFSLNNP